jgi:hypothetical protein
LVAAIQDVAGTFSQVFAPDSPKSPGRYLVQAKQLDALHTVVRDLGRQLGPTMAGCPDHLFDAAQGRSIGLTDLVRRLQKDLELLECVTEDAVESVQQNARQGRPREAGRVWLAQEVYRCFEQAGSDPASRIGARALGACLRIMLRALGQPVPTDLRPLLKAARRPLK